MNRSDNSLTWRTQQKVQDPPGRGVLSPMWTMGRERIRSVLTATMIEGSSRGRAESSGVHRVVVRAGGYLRRIDEEANVDEAPRP